MLAAVTMRMLFLIMPLPSEDKSDVVEEEFDADTPTQMEVTPYIW